VPLGGVEYARKGSRAYACDRAPSTRPLAAPFRDGPRRRYNVAGSPSIRVAKPDDIAPSPSRCSRTTPLTPTARSSTPDGGYGCRMTDMGP